MGLEWLEERPVRPLLDIQLLGHFIKEAEMHFWTFLNTRLCSNTAQWLAETLIQAHQEAGLSSINQMASWWLCPWTAPLLARKAARASRSALVRKLWPEKEATFLGVVNFHRLSSKGTAGNGHSLTSCWNKLKWPLWLPPTRQDNKTRMVGQAG